MYRPHLPARVRRAYDWRVWHGRWRHVQPDDRVVRVRRGQRVHEWPVRPRWTLRVYDGGGLQAAGARCLPRRRLRLRVWSVVS